MTLRFDLLQTDGRARAGSLNLPSGVRVETPVFMPVGTQATVKTLDSSDLKNLGVGLLLCNAYHLYLRPGAELISGLGGLHAFMGWPGGIITDSGGFQVFSMSELRKILPGGVEFTSHLDGSRHLFTPENNMQFQHWLGADILMALDVCVPYPSPPEEVRSAVERTSQWARQCLEEHSRLGGEQALFGIVQGGVVADARRQSARDLVGLDLPGYAVGGLSVGEGPFLMNEILETVDPLLPAEKPRYLMGVGTPLDLWEAVERGMDMMDCAMPTRIARNGTLFTRQGRINLRNARYQRDESPVDPECSCPACRGYSRAYLRHLIKSGEMTGLRLSTLHNLTFMLQLARFIREAILTHQFAAAKKDFSRRYGQTE